MACRTGCPTQDHASWGDCLRASNIQMNAGDAKHTSEVPRKKWDNELQAYRDARAEGIQPAGTTYRHIDAARAASDKLGRAYNAETMVSANKMDKQHAAVTNYIETGKES